mmetsp:Transcript_76365/g.205359  ORF Transcript_76365/g.205359 Transcript_76365/m.205359 type:complete len:127 (+) Transcript_76365:135-515(+)
MPGCQSATPTLMGPIGGPYGPKSSCKLGAPLERSSSYCLTVLNIAIVFAHLAAAAAAVAAAAASLGLDREARGGADEQCLAAVLSWSQTKAVVRPDARLPISYTNVDGANRGTIWAEEFLQIGSAA